MIEEVDIKEHMENLLNALVALSPSRNYVSQFITMMPQDQSDVLAAYPKFIEDEKTKNIMSRIFDIKYGSEVKREEYNALGQKLNETVTSILGILDSDDLRNELSVYLKDIRTEEIPNPYREWIKIKIDGLLDEPNYGKNSLKILKLMMDENIYINTSDLSKAPSKVNLSQQELSICLQLLEKYRLVKKSGDNYSVFDSDKKHLDLIEKAYNGVE